MARYFVEGAIRFPSNVDLVMIALINPVTVNASPYERFNVGGIATRAFTNISYFIINHLNGVYKERTCLRGAILSGHILASNSSALKALAGASFEVLGDFIAPNADKSIAIELSKNIVSTLALQCLIRCLDKRRYLEEDGKECSAMKNCGMIFGYSLLHAGVLVGSKLAIQCLSTALGISFSAERNNIINNIIDLRDFLGVLIIYHKLAIPLFEKCKFTQEVEVQVSYKRRASEEVYK